MAGPTTRLLILCSAAVGAIYASGYVVTQPTAQASGTPTSTASSTPSPSAGKAPKTTQATAPHAHAASYKDGQYSGTGSNAYGVLSVRVTIKGGKITAAQITSYAMHYPQSYIDPTMPDEVLSKQTYQVYGVSGATASSENFAEAVYNALQKAKA